MTLTILRFYLRSKVVKPIYDTTFKEMRNTSTLNLAEERKKYLIKKVNDKENRQYT